MVSIGIAFAAGALAAPLRFDMGTDSSPVASGFTRVTPVTKYSRQQGFGWESGGQTGFDVIRPPENPQWRQPAGQAIPKDYVQFKEHNDVTRDGVESSQDLAFRADVSNGTYRVAITLGHLDRALGSMQVFLNGAMVADELVARHWVQRARPDFQYGFPRTIRRTVEVKDGTIRVRVHGDESGFHRRFHAEFNKPGPQSFITGGVLLDKKPERADPARWGQGRGAIELWVWEDIGGPFRGNAINAVEIAPLVAPPVSAEGRRAAVAFQAKRFKEAEAAFNQVADPYERAAGYLRLAGHPDYEEEQRLVPKALALLESAAAHHRDDPVFQETLANARRMNKGLHRFYHRADELRTYTELLLISGEVDSIEPGDPLYYKARMYAARGLHMIIPHRWTFAAGAGRQMFEQLERAGFGSNRYVRWYLHGDWSPEWSDWAYTDYSAKKQGAPAWAAEIYEGFNRGLDLAEWWFRHRQRPDGALGGSWGDDVEVLRSFGAFVAVSPDASPFALNGVRKVADGAWFSGSVDTEAGYFAEVGDTEHSGEWTADTLVAMTRIDFGNPIYIERALKTGKLMRDLWMDFNDRGHFLMRSNYLGATGVGGPGTLNDSRINYRPASPAFAVLRYNNLPSLSKLFVQWADAWLAASMSTEKGKPRGIIPQEIGFARSEMGGTNAPTWFKADNPPGTDTNYDWEGAAGYHEAIVELFQHAAEATGDKKYLEPLEIEAAFVREHCPPSACESEHARGGRLHASMWMNLEPGSNAWIAARLATWPRKWEQVRDGARNLLTVEQAAARSAEENSWAKKRWPHVTTEAIATDRIGWIGWGNALRSMTAYGVQGQQMLVTYRGWGREFAAMVERADHSGLRVRLYNMSRDERAGGVVPWALPVGAEYRCRAGTQEQTMMLRSLGQEIPVTLPGRTEVVLEVTRTTGTSKQRLVSDLSLSSADVRFVPEYHRLDVTVHNIGAAAARKIVVILMEGGREVGRQVIPNIEAPVDLDPKVVRIGFEFTPAKPRHAFTVVIDPDGKIEELTDRNNRVTVEIDTPAVPRKQHSSA